MIFVNKYARTHTKVKNDNFANVAVACFKATLSKVLGLGIIGGSLLG